MFSGVVPLALVSSLDLVVLSRVVDPLLFFLDL